MADSLYVYKIKSVIKVVDGDTIDCILDLGFNILLNERVRLAGIDAPETSTVNQQEKRLGKESRTWLENKLKDKTNIIIRTEFEKTIEKYGRTLGWIYVDNICLNKLMIDEGYAWEYDGGKKTKDLDILENKRKIHELAIQ